MCRLVAAEIRAEMTRQGLYQQDVARLMHQSQPWVSRRLSGHVDLTLNEVELFAAALLEDASGLEFMVRATDRWHRQKARTGLAPSGGKVASGDAVRRLQAVPSPRHVTLRPHSPRPILQVLSGADTSGA